MIRRFSCLLLALATAACVPPEPDTAAQPAAPVQGAQKPQPADQAPATPGDTATAAPKTRPPTGMLLLDPTQKLPEDRDMEPTAPAAPGGGVTVTPPASADGR